jgi:hypothetical protein
MAPLKVYAFVDYSNINLMSQKMVGVKNGYPPGINDICTKVIPSKIFDFLKQHHSSGLVRRVFNICDKRFKFYKFRKEPSWNNYFCTRLMKSCPSMKI